MTTTTTPRWLAEFYHYRTAAWSSVNPGHTYAMERDAQRAIDARKLEHKKRGLQPGYLYRVRQEPPHETNLRD